MSQRAKARKATLAKLTNGSPSLTKQNALFDDTPRSSIDIPGSLHLASAEHIERLIAKSGAVNLIRQYAQDLAHRDAEMSSLRIRADVRERELKRMLREAKIPTADVEKRLLKLEQSLSIASSNGRSISDMIKSPVTLGGLMNEAMHDGLTRTTIETAEQGGSTLAIDATSPLSDLPPLITGVEQQTENSLPSKLSRTSSPNTSRTNSITSGSYRDLEATIRQRSPDPTADFKRMSNLQTMFQPPNQSSSYFIGGSKTIKKSKAVDEVSVRSNQSSRSFASWTNIFGGKSSSARPRSESVGHESVHSGTPTEAQSLLSKMAKSKNNPTIADIRGGIAIQGQNPKASVQRSLSTYPVSTTPLHIRKDSITGNQAPVVELDSMIESSELPPTMTARPGNKEGVLVDRFGFIYDQRRRRRQGIPLSKHKKNKLSTAETIASHRSRDESPDRNYHIVRPNTPRSMDEDGRKSWQDYLKVATSSGTGRPRELLVHTPSAGAVITVNVGSTSGSSTPNRYREGSISISTAAQKALPTTSLTTEPQTSSTTIASGEFAPESAGESAADFGPAKMLLDQLNELHDSLQAERAARWNDFLRKVRADRATQADRNSYNAPEAELLNGEIIGLATAGRTAKARNKYLVFKSLVLGGIPVSLRPKIWAECSGATTLRIPGYYDDLVGRSEDGVDVDPDIAQQIQADIGRTLTDNVFFRSGPGVKRLEELLRAYSVHNPRIGYCQGMNLITASLLLICATPEDCFWLLVAIIDHILPSGYFDRNLLVSRADQIVLRQYVAEVLPKLDAKLIDLGVELEACTFHWFLSLYTGVLTGGEALYRIWDVVICLNSLNSNEPGPNSIVSQQQQQQQQQPQSRSNSNPDIASFSYPSTPVSERNLSLEESDEHDGTGSAFLFQLSLALLKLNETAILGLESAAQVYTYINHNMTNHAISIDALVSASEGLRAKIVTAEVLERRTAAVKSLGG